VHIPLVPLSPFKLESTCNCVCRLVYVSTEHLLFYFLYFVRSSESLERSMSAVAEMEAIGADIVTELAGG